ncbi:MAG TPA: hypothetical protein VK972_10380, partial [Wenzhouxiangella sp.]|nr:hypothetical protein [Wenzhouxiangella sp.]
MPKRFGLTLPPKAAPAVMGAGAVVLLAGLWLLWSALSGDEAGPTDSAARDSIDQIGATINMASEALASEAVTQTAVAVLSGEADSDSLRRQLQSAGVANLLDVRVFPPGIENIEIGAYPEPDFAVVQMLLGARGQGIAPAEVHYPGTANENLAFARALPGPADDEEPTVAGYLFVRLPVSVVTRRLAQPGPEGWLALQQNQTVIASNGRLAADRVPDGQATIAGSRLRLNWTTGRAAGKPSPVTGGVVAVVGLLLLAAGQIARRQQAGSPDEAESGPPREADVQASA